MKRNAAAVLAAALATLVVALVPVSSQAKPGRASATYIATPAFRISLEDLGQPYGYGGYVFTPKGRPTHLKVEDVDGPGITWVACQEGRAQDGESPTTCGDGDDITVSDCSNNKFQRIRGRFVPRQPVSVFIFVNNPGIWVGAQCDGIGVAGTVTLKWR